MSPAKKAQLGTCGVLASHHAKEATTGGTRGHTCIDWTPLRKPKAQPKVRRTWKVLAVALADACESGESMDEAWSRRVLLAIVGIRAESKRSRK